MAQQPFGQATLAEQMKQLQRRVEKREKRRAADREGRAAGGDYDGGRSTYDDRPHRPPGPPAKQRRAANATGGLPLGSAAAAVAAAGLLAGPEPRRCELCSATFASEGELAVHLEGASHRKALERQAAEAERRRRLGAYADVAASAVAQAAWQGAARREQQPRPSGAQGRGQPADRQQAQQARGGRGGGRGAAAPPARELTSHAEMLRNARGEGKGRLDIDGWVPPSVPTSAAAPTQLQEAAAAMNKQEEEENASSSQLQQASPLPLGSLAANSKDTGGGGHRGGGHGGGEEAASASTTGTSSSGSSGSDSEAGEQAPVSFFTF